MFDESLEFGYMLQLEDAIDEIPIELKSENKKIKFEEVKTPIIEEKVFKSNDKIKISRLDLFDDE